jgi:ubiquinone biosynthesis protein
VGWRGLLRNLKSEAPQWPVLLPQLPRLLHQSLAARLAQDELRVAVEALLRSQQRQNRWLAVISALILLLAFMLALH